MSISANASAGWHVVGHDWLRRRVPQELQVRRTLQREDLGDEGERRSGAPQSLLDERDVQTQRAREEGVRTPVRWLSVLKPLKLKKFLLYS